MTGEPRKIKKAVLLLSWLVVALPCAGEIIIVDDGGYGDFDNIQAAIDDSNDGDIIYVLPGTYTGPGNRDIDYGGRAITVTGVDPEDPYIVAATVIDCNGSAAENHRGFIFASGEDPNSVLAGLTITDGYADYGGGIYCDSSSPRISNCIITENSADYRGGGISCNSSYAIITYCTISNNNVWSVDVWSHHGGGGIYCYYSSPSISHCTVSGNLSNVEGGGMCCTAGRMPAISNCEFVENSARWGGGMCSSWYSVPRITACAFRANVAQYGGGTYSHDSGPDLKSCAFAGNAAQYGGGIYCRLSHATITDCTVSNNIANADGGGIFCKDNDAATINNGQVVQNSAGRWGGGMYWDSGGPEVTGCAFNANTAEYGGGVYGDELYGYRYFKNCTFTGNVANVNGGGLCCLDKGVIMSNCTFCNNVAQAGSGGGVWGPWEVESCVFWDNRDSNGAGPSAHVDGLTVSYSCIQNPDANDANVPFGGAENGNIDDYPMFVREPNDGGDGWGDDPCTPGLDEGANDDFGDLHLQSNSPCINTGNPFAWLDPNGADIDGQPRVMGLVVDMGADEHFMKILAVTEPQGGEVWASGSTHEILWVSDLYEGIVDILFSTDDANNWQSIEANLPNTGSYTWHLPAVDSNQCAIAVIPSVPDPNVNTTESGPFTIHPDSPCPPVVSKWESLGGDYDRKGRSENYGPELGCVKWELEVDGAISAGVTVGANDTVYVPCEDGNLYKLDSNGVVLWSYEASSPLISSPSIGPDGTAYVGSQDRKLYAVDANGNLRWTHSTGGMVYSSPAVSADGNTIFVGSEDGTLCALGRDGSELWRFETHGFGETEGAIFASPAIGPNGTVYVAGLYDPNLYALDPNDGSVKWVCNFEYLIDPYHPWEGTESGWPFASPVVAPDGTIYQALAYDPNLYAIEPNGGTISWSTDLVPHCDFIDDYLATNEDYPPIELIEQECEDWFGIAPIYWFRHMDSGCWSEPALGPDGTIYVSYEDPFLRAVEPNGAIKWVTRLGVMGGFTLTVGGDGLIYAASDDGYVCVVDANGNELSRFATDKWLGFPVVLADNTLIVGDSMDNTMLISYTDNKLWALGGQDCQGQPLDLHRPEDLDMNGPIDFVDFAHLAADWLACTDQYDYPQWGGWWPLCDNPRDQVYLTGDVDRNLYVDWADVATVANWWLSED